MKNSTKFLDDIMKNSIHLNLVIDITDKPIFEDWWRFEEECLGQHFGMNKDECEDWWNTWFEKNEPDNFILLEINIKGEMYEVTYITEVNNLDSFYRPIDLLIHFSEIYNKYLLKPLPETLGETKNKNICILSQEELDELCGIAEEREQPKEFDHKKAKEDLLKRINRVKSDAELILEEQLKEAQKEIETLSSKLKYMEEAVKRYEHNLTFIWTILEQKIKESE